MKQLISLLEGRRNISDPWTQDDLQAREKPYVRDFSTGGKKEIIFHDVSNIAAEEEPAEWEKWMENVFLPMVKQFRPVKGEMMADAILVTPVADLRKIKNLLAFYAKGIGSAWIKESDEADDEQPDFQTADVVANKPHQLSFELDNLEGLTANISFELDRDTAVWNGYDGTVDEKIKWVRVSFSW